MSIFASLWRYIKVSFPDVGLRYLHIALAVIVVVQILNSNLLHMTSSGELKNAPYDAFFLWLHIACGTFAIILTIFLIVFVLTRQSFRQFFPYLFGDNDALKNDISLLRNKTFPPPREKGLANIIQGLGIGALILIETAALTWFILWSFDSPYANEAREVHKSLTGLIEVYLIGHGGMALLHFFMERKRFRE